MEERNKIYTAADLARYHNGTMTTGEMHELEKAALEDPFLEDALEGYGHTTSAEGDIKELQFRLAKKRKKKNVFFVSSLVQNKWWRIAALFIIMAGAGYFFYRINLASKENSLAKNEVKILTEKKDNIASTKKDSSVIKNELAFESRPAINPAQKQKNVPPGVRSHIEKEVVPPTFKKQATIASNYSAQKPKDRSSSDTIQFENFDKEANSPPATGYVLTGKVTDENGYPVPFANIADNIHHKATVADTAGRFALRSEDSSITAIASAMGYTSKNFTLTKDMPPTIAMNKSNAELSSVVVTNGYGNTKRFKKSAAPSAVLNEKAGGVQITSSGLHPSESREKFDQYLKESTLPVYGENNERLTGEVSLSFTINKKGRPKNIKVVKSSCQACEEEAVTLLQNGPAWAGAKNIPATVVIRF